jgi:HEAT repeat protein
MKRTIFVGLAMAMAILGRDRLAWAYVDLAPSLSKVVSDAPTIAMVQVKSYDREKHVVTLAPVRTLKGTMAPDTFAHELAPASATVPRQVLQWAIPGSRAVLFQSRTAARGTALLCFGTGWYQVNVTGTGTWKRGSERPDLPLAYYGSVSRLAEGVEAMLKGQGAVITLVAYGANNGGASFDLALNRQSLPGVVRVERIRATPSMPGTVASVSSNPLYFVGLGAVDERDLPGCLEQLKSSDATVRADAAEDLRSLGRKARSAAPALSGLLKDKSPHVRCAAASALQCLLPKDQTPLAVLSTALADGDAATRYYAAAAVGYCGAAAQPLAERLAALLEDPDEVVRLTALEAIAMLGPAAEKAAPAVTRLLDKKELVIDAADTLGRIGPAAAPAMPKLTALLSSDQNDVCWAAVRAMSQIGGSEARPALLYMVRKMPTATEVEGYNMMIYLALLGPVAQEAASSLQSFRIKNPWLPSATAWAIDPNRGFPWLLGGGGRGGRGGRGGGGPGGMGGETVLGVDGTQMYPSYVRELGFRLRSMSPKLAEGIMKDTVGNVPKWGYALLNAGPDLSLKVLTPYLKDTSLEMRERAAVAIGFMGEDAAPAKADLEVAVAGAATEQERKLLQWTLRQIDAE